MDADRTQDLITKAKREGFDSGAAWMLLGACWAFILGFGVWAVIGELDNVDTGIWKGPIGVAIMALAVLLWWLPRSAQARAAITSGPALTGGAFSSTIDSDHFGKLHECATVQP